jgi:hypothetical protein
MAPNIVDRLLGRTKPKGPQKALGRSGTVNSRGFLAEDEFNPKLRWPMSLDVYDEMRRSDPTIRWMLALVSTPIRSAHWEVDAVESDDPEDKEIAAFVEHALKRELAGGWDEFLRQALLYLAFGHSVFERVAEMREVTFTFKTERMEVPKAEPPKDPAQAAFTPKPKPVLVQEEKEVKRQAFIISKLAPRLPRTIQEWTPDAKDESILKEIKQYLGDGRAPSSVTIPAERLVVFTHEKEGDDWRGMSLLRTAYKSYQFKRKLENLEAIAYERSAGLPVVYPPASSADPNDIDDVEAAVKKIRQGESLYLIMPGPKAGSTQDGDGWLVEDLGIKADAGSNPNEAIMRYENAMAKNILAEFMRLGHEDVGARATADVQQDPYYQAVEAHVRYIEDTINEQIVKPLVDWNYQVENYPRMRASKIQAKNVQMLVGSVAQLMNVGALNSSPELERWLREILDAPPTPPGAEDADMAQAMADAQRQMAQAKLKPAEPSTNGKPQPPPGKGEAEQRPGESEAGQGKPGQGKAFAMPDGPHPAESYVSFDDIVQFLDDSEGRIVSAAEVAAEPGIRDMEAAVETAVRRRAPAMLEQISMAPGAIATALEAELRRLYFEGQTQVNSEIRRQIQVKGLKLGAAFAEATPPDVVSEIVVARALTTAESIAGQATRAARNLGLRRIEHPMAAPSKDGGVGPQDAVRTAARAAARSLSTSVFNLGRKDAMAQRMDEVSQERTMQDAIDARLAVLFAAKTVGPHAREQLRSLLAYYAKKPHPFTSCVRDNRKRFGPRTEAVCATLKDILMGTTRWRHGSKGLSEEGAYVEVTDPDAPEISDEVLDLLGHLSEEEVDALFEGIPFSDPKRWSKQTPWAAKGPSPGRFRGKGGGPGGRGLVPISANAIDVGDDVERAAQLLGEGKEVELNQPSQVATLLTKLGEIVKEAERKGDAAPDYDLCKVSVKGTNLFCVESHGIPRIDMPQLKGVPAEGSTADKLEKDDRGEVDISDEFRQHLIAQGIPIHEETERSDHLRATQRELNGVKVGGMLATLHRGERFHPDPPLFISRDGYIVDGHHRWAAKVALDLEDNEPGDIGIRVERIDAGIIQILAEARAFANEWGLPQAGFHAGPKIDPKTGLPSKS